MTSIPISCKRETKIRSRFYIYGSGDHQLISSHDKVPYKQDVRFHPVLSPNIDKEISTVSSLSTNNILASKMFHPKDTEHHKNKVQHKHSSKGIFFWSKSKWGPQTPRREPCLRRNTKHVDKRAKEINRTTESDPNLNHGISLIH